MRYNSRQLKKPQHIDSKMHHAYWIVIGTNKMFTVPI